MRLSKQSYEREDYKSEVIVQMFPKDQSKNNIIIDPDLYLSDQSKDYIYHYMNNFPLIKNKKVLNILIIVDTFVNAH